MGKKAEKSKYSDIPAIVMGAIAAVLTMILFGHFINQEDSSKEISSFDIIAAIGYGISLTIACFIICRIHPKSVWYTPVICSVPIISSYFTMIPFSTHLKLVWIILVCGIVLSVVGSIVGARMGLQLSNQVK